MSSCDHEVFVLYGSQTGQAEAIATEIHEAAVFQNYKASLRCLKDEGKSFSVTDIHCAVFVCSTTGDGDPPENARKFIRNIGRKTLAGNYLSTLKYALLGLGDSNYSTFCGGPKKLEKALKARGASSFYRTAFADDGTDLEETVEPWIDGLFPALQKHFQSLQSPDVSEQCTPSNESSEQSNNTDSSSLTETSVKSIADDFRKIVLTNSDSSVVVDDQFAACNGELSTRENRLDAKQELETLSSNFTIKIADVTNSPLVFSTLGDVNLTLPPLVPTYLEMKFDDKASFDASTVPYQNGAAFTLSSSEIVTAEVTKVRQLSSDNAVKRALEVQLAPDSPFDYKPGDSFAICCENDQTEVNWLIHRLSHSEDSDVPASLSICTETTKKNAQVPSYIPQPFTIRYLLSKCLEIRAVPKKPLLRALVECTNDFKEKRRLQELCSRQGAEEYAQFIRSQYLSVLDLLITFSSCQPTLPLLIQHLPRLQPRRYSITSSPLVASSHVTFAFNVVRFTTEGGRSFVRNGVCTGSLEKRYQNSNYIVPDMHRIEIFPCKTTGFCLPDDLTTPLVMIGPGTGVAPFLGFLQHRKALNVKEMGESWLFYGCRHKGRDFLYKEELEKFLENKVLTKLIVAFSRDPPEQGHQNVRYVQDNLRHYGTDVVDLLLNKQAVFYVCGDARNMAKDVRQCIIELIANEMNCDTTNATDTFKKIVAEKRYREDIWS